MRREPIVLFDNGTHQCLMFDDLVSGEGVQSNQFLITDHEQTGAVVVCLPEEMPVNETVKLEGDLRDDIDVAVDRVIMNGMYPERFIPSERPDLEAMADSDDPVIRAAGMAGVSESRRREAQEEQLKRLQQAITSTPITTLPFLFEPELSLEAARQLGELID